uniref:Glycosyltransferase family 92 protein n=1 Tax=Rhizochromulina marina TaxID=1034831 RepID=A0A7S2SWB6_9STRA|mmetsp:Transcript_9235/g.26235  ORF Transcript_9235/g.26235 Transcript_9235/m.26235 type:complete len:447 (+) Transcript_9235:10-1350(+)
MTPASEGPNPSGAAVVCTVKVAARPGADRPLQSWCRWHLQGVGFRHLFLFFDHGESAVDEGSGVPLLVPDSTHPTAVALRQEFPPSSLSVLAGKDGRLRQWQRDNCASWETLEGFVQDEVQARQSLNAETAAHLARDMGIAWLLHMDSDELFYCGEGGKVEDHFRDLDREGIDQLTYLNHEAVPEREDVGDFFQEVTLFRRHHFTVPLRPQAQACMRFWERRTNHGQYMLVYDNGKSAARVHAIAGVQSVHHWRLATDARSCTALADPRKMDLANLRKTNYPCILHYVTCGLSWLRDKYGILGEFPDAWFGGKLPIAPSFHLDARDALAQGGDVLRALYSSQVMLGPQEEDEPAAELDRQINSGVCFRVEHVSQYLRGDEAITTQWTAASLENAAVEEPPQHYQTSVPPPPPVAAAPAAAEQVPAEPGVYGFEKAWIISSAAQGFL